MNHLGKGFREDELHCVLKGINAMLMPWLMARNTHPSTAARLRTAVREHLFMR